MLGTLGMGAVIYSVKTSIQPYRVAVIILRIVLREAEGKQAEPGYWELSFSKIVMVLNLAGSRDKG